MERRGKKEERAEMKRMRCPRLVDRGLVRLCLPLLSTLVWKQTLCVRCGRGTNAIREQERTMNERLLVRSHVSHCLWVGGYFCGRARTRASESACARAYFLRSLGDEAALAELSVSSCS